MRRKTLRGLTTIVLATLLTGSICTPKPGLSDVDTAEVDLGRERARTAPEGDRAGSGFWRSR